MREGESTPFHNRHAVKLRTEFAGVCEVQVALSRDYDSGFRSVFSKMIMNREQNGHDAVGKRHNRGKLFTGTASRGG